jgi:pimeloyl-ACP methyl ester carboxylesterase
VVRNDESSTTRLTVGIYKELLSADPLVANRWAQVLANLRSYAELHQGVVTEYDEGSSSGLDIDFNFQNLEEITQILSEQQTGIFESFQIRRWRGVISLEGNTTSALLQKRISEITGLSTNEILLINFPLEVNLLLPGRLIDSNADLVKDNDEQTWYINWLADGQHLFAAHSQVPLIPLVIEEPANGTRISDPMLTVTFRGTGEPGADLRLYKIDPAGTRTQIASGRITADGSWELAGVDLGEPGDYKIEAEEETEYEKLVSGEQSELEVRPRSPVIFVPGYYACSEGLLGFDVQWQDTGMELLNPEAEGLLITVEEWLSTGLLPTVISGHYATLFQSLFDAGYQLNQDFYVACYNWSDDLPGEAAKFGEVLDNAALHNLSGMPITIITHSNGALVARYWIMHHPEETRALIRDVIMIAPPNHGVFDAYPAWEGGDLSRLDPVISILVKATLLLRCGILPPLDSSTDMLHYQKQVYGCSRWEDPSNLDYFDLKTKPDEQIASIAWLLPTCTNVDSCKLLNYPDAPVTRLNEPSNLEKMAQGIQGKWYVIAGNEGDTLATMHRVPATEDELPLWKLGKPEEGEIFTPGDLSVAQQSSMLDEFSSLYPDRYEAIMLEKSSTIEDLIHSTGMVQEEVILQNISDIIQEPEPDDLILIDNQDFMIILVASPVNLLVTTPGGKRIGISDNGHFMAEITNASYGHTADPLGPKVVILPNPPGGEYTYQITGVSDGEYKILSLATTQTEPILTAEGTIRQGEVQELKAVHTPVERTDGPGAGNRTAPILLCSILVGVIILAGLGLYVQKARRKSRRQAVDGYGFNDWDQGFEKDRTKKSKSARPRKRKSKKDDEFYY